MNVGESYIGWGTLEGYKEGYNHNGKAREKSDKINALVMEEKEAMLRRWAKKYGLYHMMYVPAHNFDLEKFIKDVLAS